MIRAFVVDDHPLVRRGVINLLNEEPGLKVVGEAGNAAEALERIPDAVPHVLLLDISMPGRNGLDLLKDVKTRFPDVPVLVLSMHNEDRFAVRALRAGASGYVTKSAPAEELIGAIRRVSEGKAYVSPSLADLLVHDLDADASRLPHERLSDREYQVLCMIAQGKRVREIAAELALSVHTIGTFRARVLKKLKLKTNMDLTRYALTNRLID